MSPLVTRPSLPEPGTVGGIDAAFGGELAHRRRQRRVRRPAPSARQRRRGAAAAAAGGAAALAGAAAGLAAARRRAVIDLAEQRADRDGLAVLGRDLAEHAGGRRRHFDGDLVGLELDQRLVHRHGIAGLLEPAADGGLGHGLAERRNANFSHGLFPHCVMVGSSAAIQRRDGYRKREYWMPRLRGHDESNASSAPRPATP